MFFFQDSVGRAQKYVQSELERFQETLHRCVLSCQVYSLTTISKPQFKVLGKIRYNSAGWIFFCAWEIYATEHDGNWKIMTQWTTAEIHGLKIFHLWLCTWWFQDEVKDKVTPTTSDSDIAKYQKEFELCAIKCCDKNVDKLPGLTEKVKQGLQLGHYSVI